MIAQQIENVIITVLVSRGKKRKVVFYIPSGMSDLKFSSFKDRNKEIINNLKKGKLDENSPICIQITPQSQSVQTFSVPFEFGTQERLSNHINIQKLKKLKGKYRGYEQYF
jgi:hypothetical protein